ncbi:MAG: hypothetical protein ACREPP_01765 [Rhodanobacteraceae bacterium]
MGGAGCHPDTFTPCSSFRGGHGRSPWQNPESRLLLLLVVLKSWIPGSIAGKSGDGPGMTMDVCRGPASHD